MDYSGDTDDWEETQRLNPDSPHSDYEDCTLPLDEEELGNDNGCFYGETQALEEDVNAAELEVEEKKVEGFTLVQTQVIDCSDDDSERTLQLGDVDDDETSFRGVGRDGNDARHLEEGHSKCSSVDYDGSTEEEGRSVGIFGPSFASSGSRRRSLADFRVASLRANRLSAVSKLNCKSVDAEKNISGVEDSVIGAESVKNLETNNVLSYSKDVSAFPETGIRELQSNCKKDKWGKSTEKDYTDGIDEKTGSRTARRLFYNETGLEKIHPIDKLNVECDQEKANTMVCDYSVVGLSYNTSQEPGDLSQANAINVVDAFLALNDIEISDAGLEMTGEFKTPLHSNLKGTQYLAKTSSKNPIDKSAAFDWVDALEDESGGGFFSKRKDSIFAKSISGKKTWSCSPKPRQLHPEMLEDNFENGNKKRNARLTSLSKIKNLSLSNAKVKANLTGSNKLLTSTVATKDLFEEKNSPLVADSTIQHLDRGEENTDTAVTWDVGPDTQMAAQALESMVSGPVDGNNSSEACPIARDVLFSNQNSMTKKGSPGHDSQIKRISPVSHLIGSKRRYVKKKLSGRKIINESLISSTRKLRSSRMKECSEEATLIEGIDMKSKEEEPSGGKYVSSRRSNNSIKRLMGQEEGQIDIEKMDRKNACLNGVELPLDKESFQVDDRWSSPVAHRTRRSRDRKSLGISHGFFSGNPGKVKYRENDDSEQATGCSFESNAIQNEQQQITFSHFNMQVDEIPEKDAQKTSPDPIVVISCHPKRRRTRGAYAEEVNTINLDLQCDLQRTKSSVSAVHNLEKANADSMAVTQGHLKSEASRKVKTRPSDTPQSSPSNKIEEAASPVCVATRTPKGPKDKCLSGSSLKREVRRLHSTIQTSTPLLKYSQRRNDMATVRILFSRHLDDDIINKQKKILARLKLPVASSISDATHFISDKFVRTRNMLEAMSVGKPVVTPLWLENCDQAGFCVDEKNYILKDFEKEKEVGFSMAVSLARACERPLLQDKRVFITANVKPDRRTVSSLVKASGGQPLERIIRSLMKHEIVPEDLLIISCEEDYRICISLLEKGSEVFSSELILNGIVVQKLEYDRHRLFSDHVRRTRSTIFLRNENTDKFHPVPKFK